MSKEPRGHVWSAFYLAISIRNCKNRGRGWKSLPLTWYSNRSGVNKINLPVWGLLPIYQLFCVQGTSFHVKILPLMKACCTPNIIGLIQQNPFEHVFLVQNQNVAEEKKVIAFLKTSFGPHNLARRRNGKNVFLRASFWGFWRKVSFQYSFYSHSSSEDYSEQLK